MPVLDVAQVRDAEAELLAALPDGALMHRASFGLAVRIAHLVRERVGHVAGSRIVLLVGQGNNGGDALFAGAELARRGAAVSAVPVAGRVHPAGAAALRAAGGRTLDIEQAREALRTADAVVDGIVGIGGVGDVRSPARELLALADGSAVIAVDVPSGVDADTGDVAGEAVTADLTVTFGCYKPGLLLAPGRDRCGEVALVDIGLGPVIRDARSFVLEPDDVVRWLPRPSGSDYKYSRGVAGLRVGSAQYPGAGLLSVGAARAADIGMVMVSPPAPTGLIEVYPDVVIGAPTSRTTALCIGPGLGRGAEASASVTELLDVDAPLVLDADALHVVDRAALQRRGRDGRWTVLTPHDGEFRALGFDVGGDRRAAAVRAARELDCVVVLKGAGTVVAAPDGRTFLDARTTAALGTAGSGDVLAGLMTGLLAGAQARGALSDAVSVAECAAAAVWLHSATGLMAGSEGAVHAPDLVALLGRIIHVVRSREESGAHA